MDITVDEMHRDILKLQRQIDLLSKILLNEGKLTVWAKKELAKAKSEKENSYTSLNDL